MSVDVSDWTARKKLKYSLLRRAFEQNRGSEVILLIQWRLAMERHKNAEGAAIARDFEAENAGQPRAIRALNLIMKERGLTTTYKDTATLPKPPTADVYIKPGFLERLLERVGDEALPIYDHLNANPPVERITSSYTRLMDIVNDYAQDNIFIRSAILEERMDEAVEALRIMPVASNDKAVRLDVTEAAKIIKRPDYDDAEDAQSAEEYVTQTIETYFDEDPDNDVQVTDEVLALAARTNGPKFGWQ